MNNISIDKIGIREGDIVKVKYKWYEKIVCYLFARKYYRPNDHARVDLLDYRLGNPLTRIEFEDGARWFVDGYSLELIERKRL